VRQLLLLLLLQQALIPPLSTESRPSSLSFVYDKLAGLVGEKLTAIN